MLLLGISIGNPKPIESGVEDAAANPTCQILSVSKSGDHFVAAARMGYRPVGIDPSLKGIRTAWHLAQQMGIEAHYVVCGWQLSALRERELRSDFLLQCSVASFQRERPPDIAGSCPGVVLYRRIPDTNAKLFWHSLSL